MRVTFMSSRSLKYMMTSIVLLVSLGAVEKTGGFAVKVRAKVPFGVAFLGSVMRTVGHKKKLAFGSCA